MDMVTVKRNGVYISFPELKNKEGVIREDIIRESRINDKSKPVVKDISIKKAINLIVKPISPKSINTGYVSRTTLIFLKHT
ncbi:hypothetical protein SAMN02745136_03323 [Anaerocolumna jejuensis DSM 15929]|uniref:Uncharacterized protein n=1 Tax=Anaerocolumna jejuensis DSM 15929 TaxID=1121322 RepID=A0A1M6V8Y1_9FIRM|nr:hypothetical protein [Anaerocolumna jejuensis]SHK77814.1 hypothetical protein SAMN02745136_03323 [Anaerocolumna jejuensis DSM 15929]